MDYSTMTKTELRDACKDNGIAYGKLTNDGMRAALAPAPQPKTDEEPTGSCPNVVQPEGLKIEANRDTRNGVTRPSAGGKCRAVWDALDTQEDGKVTAERVRSLAAEHGFDKTTAQVQFYRWRKFNGISGRKAMRTPNGL